jgi:hypothetical protein
MVYTPNHGPYIAAQSDTNFPPLYHSQIPTNTAFSQPMPSQANSQNLIVYSSQPQDNTQTSVKNTLTPQISTYVTQTQNISGNKSHTAEKEDVGTSKNLTHQRSKNNG